MAETEQLFDRCVREYASGALNPVYLMNATAEQLSVVPRLTSLPWHIHPDRNPAIGVCLGVNCPTFYFAGRLAFTDLHVEDNLLDSANLIHYGEPGSGKIWLCVCPKDFRVLNIALAESIARLRTLGRDVSDYLDGCLVPANHKNIVITTEYLRSRNIEYQLITQRPGDLVYVGSGIFHQVINLGVNLAEAVNVGSSQWQAGADRFVPCGCKSNAVVAVPSNPSVDSVVRDRPSESIVCPTEGCPYSTTWKTHMLAHLQHEADPSAPRKFACHLCPRLYIHSQHLDRHVREFHGSKGRLKKACKHCGIGYSAGNLARHEKACLENPARSKVP